MQYFPGIMLKGHRPEEPEQSASKTKIQNAYPSLARNHNYSQ